MKKTYRVDEVAKDLSVSVRTVQRWIKSGELDSIRIGHTRRILGDTFEKKSDNSSQLPAVSDIKRG